MLRYSLCAVGLALFTVSASAQPTRRSAEGEADRKQSDDDAWKALATKYDKDADGRIEESEYPRGAEKFRRLDRNRDGAVTAADFAGGSRRGRGGFDPTRMLQGRLVRAADANEDGTVTAEEWAGFLKSLADADGTIADDEILALLPSRAPSRGGANRGRTDSGRGGGSRDDDARRGRDDDRADSFRRRFLGRLDRDEDGKIEIADLRPIFGELDRDDSGSVEETELARVDRGRGRGERSRRGARGERATTDVPQPGDVAPDFELPYAKDKSKVAKLSSFAGDRPVALVFGSYT